MYEFIYPGPRTFPFGVGAFTLLACVWSMVQDTKAPTTHDKPGSYTCPVYNTDTRKRFSWEEPCNHSWVSECSNSQIPGSVVQCFATRSSPLTFYRRHHAAGFGLGDAADRKWRGVPPGRQLPAESHLAHLY